MPPGLTFWSAQSGPDLMWRYCEQAERRGESIFLYGGREETLDLLQQRLTTAFPDLRIAGAWSPPFRDLTPGEDEAVTVRINDSGAGTVWMQDRGLEWLHRLLSEPRRLWKRYLVTNTLFVLGAASQLAFHRQPTSRSASHHG